MLKGKKLSILGDSISTYKGISDNPEYNRMLRFNKSYYEPPFPLEKTYWMQIINDLDLTLCVNNSFSGGLLYNENDPDSGICRARFLSRDNGEIPDIIIVFMGINDFGYRIHPDTFGSDYTKALLLIKEKHPSARVCCVNLPNRAPELEKYTVMYNEKISEAVKTAGEGFFIADFFGSALRSNIYRENTCEGLHPNEQGMKIIADFIKEALIKNCN